VSLPDTSIEYMTVDMAFAFHQLGLWILGVLMPEGVCTYPTCCLQLTLVDLLQPLFIKAGNSQR